VIKRETYKGGHTYTSPDGRRFPGVTKILGLIGGQGLIHWAANASVDYITKELGYSPDDETFSVPAYEIPLILPDICKSARKRHTIIRDAAGARGREIHSVLEHRLKGEPQSPTILKDKFISSVLKSFDKWMLDTEFSTKDSERQLVNPEGQYGGTCDAIGTSTLGLLLVDFKTSKTIQKKDRYQLAAYAVAYGLETGTYPDLCMILHVLPSGHVKEKFIMDRPAYEQKAEAFNHLIAFYKDYMG
jgi:hypothetical protein